MVKAWKAYQLLKKKTFTVLLLINKIKNKSTFENSNQNMLKTTKGFNNFHCSFKKSVFVILHSIKKPQNFSLLVEIENACSILSRNLSCACNFFLSLENLSPFKNVTIKHKKTVQ